jgi:hypothetical protein
VGGHLHAERRLGAPDRTWVASSVNTQIVQFCLLIMRQRLA